MPIKVKTRDWGAKYQQVSNHIAAKSAASVNHSQQLQNEIANHAGHAYGRHGYQAGWVEQVIRAVTQITPDQPFSPTGVEAVIREWNARWVGSPSGQFTKIVNTYDPTGQTVVGDFGKGSVPSGHATSAGVESGGFLSPELQERAMIKAMALANPRNNVKEAEYPGIKKAWKVVNRCMVVVDASPSLGYGVGYRRTTSFVARTRQEVLDLVEALQLGKTRAQAGLVSPNTIAVAPNGVAFKSDGPAFQGVGDLLDYLGLEAFWQKNALVILEKNGSSWKRVTMYPCNLAGAGWAPGNKIPGHPWSGKVKLTNNTQQTLPVPTWSPA